MSPTQQQEKVVRTHVREGCIFVVEMCRPRAKNAFNDALYEQLTAALDEFEADDSLHAFVLTGHGDYFTSGADVKETAAILGDGSVRPPSQTNNLVIRSKVYTAQEALNASIVGEIFPTNGFLEAVFAELTPLVNNRFNKTSLPVYKSLLRRERAPKIREALFYEFEQLDRRAASGEFLATVTELKKQFKNKRSRL
ncbi:Methionine aminopeptidase [Phytophthora nicotianae]|uniref:Methionine aminopeptidase n=1 Tax=Phytophthora nicotianae TaxID=4792 RepID=A0A0W8DKN1_PHYNI|nr:Methionine aminopeptidase [Phytophthora nicotianae]